MPERGMAKEKRRRHFMRNHFKKMAFAHQIEAESPISHPDRFTARIHLSHILALGMGSSSNVTINKTKSVSYFTNQWGTAMTTGFYYLAGTNEVAYCGDQEANGPAVQGTP
jgi:hypothetical protein